MKNAIKKTLIMIVLPLAFVSYTPLATGESAGASTGGATHQAGQQIASGVLAEGAAKGFIGAHKARCGSFNKWACVKAALGVVQLLQIGVNIYDTLTKMKKYSADGSIGLDNIDGLCLNPESSGCKPDSLDLQTSKTTLGKALKTNNIDNLLNATKETQSDMNDILSNLEKKGFKVDPVAGTLTMPDGQTQSLANLARNSKASVLPAHASKALSKKLAAIKKGGKGGGSRASGPKAGGGVNTIYLDEDLNKDLKAKRDLAHLKRKNKKNKENEDFLAAMADKASDNAIGVAGDDIFKMIQRRYNKKKKSKEFIFR